MTDGLSIEAFTGVCSFDNFNECIRSYAIGDNRMYVCNPPNSYWMSTKFIGGTENLTLNSKLRTLTMEV